MEKLTSAHYAHARAAQRPPTTATLPPCPEVGGRHTPADHPCRSPRVDAYPEHTEYRDTGCSLYTSCLHCPLPHCRYDTPGGAAAILRPGRDQTIAQAHADGQSVDTIAGRWSISRRTVFRILSRARRTRSAA